MFKSVIAAGMMAATLAVPAMAEGLQGSYVGAGPTIGINGGNVGGSIVGRVQIDKQPASIRPQLIIQRGVAGVVTGTYDIPAGDGVNVYVGAGVGYGNSGGLLTANNDVVGVAQLGVEGQVAPQVVLFADMKFGFGNGTSYVPTVGAAYKF